jgi:hypothetical protein
VKQEALDESFNLHLQSNKGILFAVVFGYQKGFLYKLALNWILVENKLHEIFAFLFLVLKERNSSSSHR